MLDLTTRQHDLRTPIPRGLAQRASLPATHYAMLAGRLTVRDRWIARMLAEHRVLTSTQIAAIAFPSRRATNLRLLQLHRWRITDRFQPYIGAGRAPMFYVLDVAGAHTLAHEDGINPEVLGFRAERSIGIAHSIRLAHLHGVNAVFTGLLAHARSHPDTALTAWWSESRCVRHFGDIVRPDGYGRWQEHGREIEWFLEHDTGSYALTKVVAKLTDYAALATTTKITTPLLLHFATAEREAHARTLLASAHRSLEHPEQVPIATTAASLISPTANVSEQVWLPINHIQGGRLRLIELADQWPGLSTSTPTALTPPITDAPSRLTPPAAMPPWTDSQSLAWR